MLQTLAVANYRSLRHVVVPLGRLNVVAGANASGKSNLYRALRLLAATADGGLVAALAREGGLPSVLWAGPERISRDMRSGRHQVEGGPRNEAVQLRMGFGCDDLSYAVDLGLPLPSHSAFERDPVIKRECIWGGPVFRKAGLLVDRRGGVLRATDDQGAWQVIPQPMSGFASMLTEFADPRTAPEMLAIRQRIREWRFYDHFRTDPDAPARRPQVGTFTPVLSDEGSDLAAALQTIREIGDASALDAAVADAFPGAEVQIDTADGWFETGMRQHGLLRPLRAAEFSDGVLRYLLLVAALLSPRPPELLVLNEPETSLHPDLLPALARLIVEASTRCQVVVVTHSEALAGPLAASADVGLIRLEKDTGETVISGQGLLDRPAWNWPER